MILINDLNIDLFLSLITALVGMIALSSSLIGYLATNMRFIERLILFAGGLLMIKPGFETDLIGILIFSSILFMQLRSR